MPTVIREHGAPVATVSVAPTFVATEPPIQSATPTVSAPPAATATPLPVQPATGSSAIVTWPSPAQLRLDTRLRWGHGIPSSVRRWAFLIVPAAHKYGLDPNMLAAVMTMESNGDPLALSPADARGLMQILHGPWDPRANVFLGASMLAGLYGQFGDWKLALAGYNAGAAAVTEYGGIPPYRETRDYVIIVSYLWDLYGHHHLTSARKTLYRSTLRDLQHFADQRKKVAKLARIAHVEVIPSAACPPRACGQQQIEPVSISLDPFWPVGGSPDPLQKVGPPAGS